MSLKNKSEVSMINGPEFINLSPLDINPLMSQCEIKVFYLGHNRNRSYISREVADEMAKTLRGTPIVAAWVPKNEDFGDHGHVMHIEDGEITFSCKTVPYGFVPPEAKVWYQNFTDTDEFGNQVERTYLMTTGYLWTGQFEELNKIIEEQGQPQSMELDEKTLDGHWAKDNKLGVEFFIINDATFSKLCILGDDVEPCFEGSAVTSPNVSRNFSVEDFNTTLFTMMNELKDALQSKGGSDMENEVIEVQEETVEFEQAVEIEEPVATDSEFAAEAEESETTAEVPASDETEFSAEDNVEGSIEEFAKDKEEEEEENKAASDSEPEDEEDEDEKKKFSKEEEEDKKESSEDEEDDKPSKHSLEQFEALEQELESLRAEVQELRSFKLSVVNKEKDALINRYHMLSDEDKKEIIEHKEEYSLAEIEAKLAVLYVEKNVDFSTLTGEVEETSLETEDPITSFSLEAPVAGFAPSFLSALRQTANG